MALIQGTVLHRSGEPRRAAEILRRSLEELGDEDSPLARDLTARFVSAATLVPDLDDKLQAAAVLITRTPQELSPP